MICFISKGDDSVVECVAGNDKIEAFKSWNTGKKNKREKRVSSNYSFISYFI